MQKVCKCCLAEGGGSGTFELEQYERFTASEFGRFHVNESERKRDDYNISTASEFGHFHASEKKRDNYNISEIVLNDGCVQFNITQLRRSAYQPLNKGVKGGSSFQVVVEGRTLEMCCVRDSGDDWYQVACAARALGTDGCALISVELGFERFEAFYNPLPRNEPAGGFRLPLYASIIRTRWCDKSHTKFVGHSVPPLPSPVYSCHSVGLWFRVQMMPSNSNEYMHREWWERVWAWMDACSRGQPSQYRLTALANRSLFGPDEFLESGLRSIHFIGESHLRQVADCFSSGHEHAGHIVPGKWMSMHRIETVFSYDGMNAEKSQPNSTQSWAECLGWPATRKTDYGLKSFERHCWHWRKGFAEIPLVCKHSGPSDSCCHGLYRTAMTLRLVVADQEAAVAQGIAHPWTEDDIVVAQGGTWDGMLHPNLRVHFEHDIPAFINALHALRSSAATRAARVIFVNVVAHAHDQATTGFRNSWAFAATNAHLRRLLQASASSLRVCISDQMGFTWPRDQASPDKNHFLRRRFKHQNLNHAPKGSKDVSWTAPPNSAFCIGDAGMAAARALRNEIKSRRGGCPRTADPV
eukprot:CAMPEP_0119327862 /NCGR_PEP_ID=MMETSP1333-20130426/71862_1 /TAXON_ID=418940 /ORGANISM="Scyphosphaera apsteinii, Strain RCC1455" /LENGTH=581 /DNA_ID=CAMNT_0007336575 /DNA_START=169 /DNA_END=1914 /DNA_ORIENTATION=-